jgi:hypothetical protein
MPIIMNEVYGLSIHGDAPFRSAASLLGGIPDDVHFIWAFSKDFASSGLRGGVAVTSNRMVHDVLMQHLYFSAVSGDTQHLMASMLGDREWCSRYLAHCASGWGGRTRSPGRRSESTAFRRFAVTPASSSSPTSAITSMPPPGRGGPPVAKDPGWGGRQPDARIGVPHRRTGLPAGVPRVRADGGRPIRVGAGRRCSPALTTISPSGTAGPHELSQRHSNNLSRLASGPVVRYGIWAPDHRLHTLQS